MPGFLKFAISIASYLRAIFFPENFQQVAGLVNYYNTENWTALHVTYDETLDRILELSVCQNRPFLSR